MKSKELQSKHEIIDNMFENGEIPDEHYKRMKLMLKHFPDYFTISAQSYNPSFSAKRTTFKTQTTYQVSITFIN